MRVLVLRLVLPSSILGLLVATTSSAAPHSFALLDQACGASSSHTALGACGSGKSTFASDDESDKHFAEDEAEGSMKNQLRRDSGVVCAICADGPSSGIQCGATVTLGAGGQINDYQPIVEGSETGWKVISCWTGDYTVKCNICPTTEEL